MTVGSGALKVNRLPMIILSDSVLSDLDRCHIPLRRKRYCSLHAEVAMWSW